MQVQQDSQAGPRLPCVLTSNLACLQENRRSYRENFYTASIGNSISGVILFKEALVQDASDGTSFVECLTRQGVLPGVKADEVCALKGHLSSHLVPRCACFPRFIIAIAVLVCQIRTGCYLCACLSACRS